MILILVLAGAGSGCAGAAGSVEPAPGPETTTVVTVAGPDLVAAAADLIGAVEALRGDAFETPPSIEVVDPAVAPGPSGAVEADRLAFQAARDALLFGGAGGRPTDWVARYDPETGTVQISAAVTGITPYVRAEMVRALLLALADRRFGWASAETSGEAGEALRALAEGDAEYYTDLWIDRALDVNEQLAVQIEALDRDSARTTGPGSALDAFYREAGAGLVAELVSVGGTPAVDAAYASPPITTEQVYHPARYLAGEAPLEVTLPEVSIPSGYREMTIERWGELGWRMLFSGVLGGAQALQASTGWGGDIVKIWWNGEDVLVLAGAEGDSALDTQELDEALRRWALEGLNAGAGRTDWKGIAFEGSTAYAFIGDLGGTTLLVASTDPVAGRRLRNEFFPAV